MQNLLMVLAVVFVSFNTYAQVQRKVDVNDQSNNKTFNSEGEAPGGFTHKNNRISILRELSLTAEQKQKLKELHRSNKSQKGEILNDEILGEDQKQDKLKRLKKTGFIDLRSILDDEQMAKLKTMQKERKNNNKFQQ